MIEHVEATLLVTTTDDCSAFRKRSGKVNVTKDFLKYQMNMQKDIAHSVYIYDSTETSARFQRSLARLARSLTRSVSYNYTLMNNQIGKHQSSNPPIHSFTLSLEHS